jgi:hypothetical protein
MCLGPNPGMVNFWEVSWTSQGLKLMLARKVTQYTMMERGPCLRFLLLLKYTPFYAGKVLQTFTPKDRKIVRFIRGDIAYLLCSHCCMLVLGMRGVLFRYSLLLLQYSRAVILGSNSCLCRSHGASRRSTRFAPGIYDICALQPHVQAAIACVPTIIPNRKKISRNTEGAFGICFR